jgi:hypothetical protein
VLRATYLELQFSRRSIVDLVRTSLVTSYPPFNPLLPPTGEELPTADDGTRFVTISTAFLTTPGAGAVRHGASYDFDFAWSDLTDHQDPVPARRCEVTQSVRIDLARRETRPDGQLQDVEVGIVDGTFVVDLSVNHAFNNVVFTIWVRSFTVDTPGVDPRAVKALQDHGPGRFRPIHVPLSWANLLGIAPVQNPPPGYDPTASAPAVQNAGAAFTDDLSAFALRIQVGGAPASARIDEWIAFQAGNFPSRLRQPDGSTAQWGMLLSPALVESMTRGQIEDSLAGHAGDFRLAGGVGAQWAPDGDVPYVRGSFRGTVLIFCRPSYYVAYDSRIQVTLPNTLVSTGHVDWHGDTLDLAVCEGEIALGAGLVGAAFGSSVGGPLGGGIGFLVGLGVGFIGGIVGATVYTPDLATSACTQDGNTLTCTRTLNPTLGLGPGLALPVQLTSATATADGLVMTGTFAIPALPALTQQQVAIETKPFDYTDLPVNCSNLLFAFLVATTDDVASFTHAEATITVRLIGDDGPSRPPPAVTVTLVSPDTERVFPPASFRVVPYSDRTVIYVTPLVTRTTPVNYWAAAYGCTVQVNAVVATRTVEIPAPARLTDATLTKLHARAQRALSDCLAKQQGPDTKGGRRELEWLIDPGPDDLQAAHFWQFAVLGVDVEEPLRVEDRQGRVLAPAHADARGTARAAVLTRGGAERVLVLHRADRPVDRMDVRLRQTEFVPHGVLRPGGRVEGVRTSDVNGRLIAAVRSTSAVTVYDVTFPNAAHGFLRTDAGGVSDVALLDAGIALWGAHGLTVWSFDQAPPRRLIDVPVHAVRVVRGGLLAATGEDVFHVARRGTRAVCLAARRADAASDLAVADPDRRHLHAPAAQPYAAQPHSTDAPSALEYHAVGSTVLVATPNGTGLQVFAVGRSIQA